MLLRQSVPSVLLACVLAACGSTTDSSSGQPSEQASVSPYPTVTVLDEKMAGDRYMTIICPANAALSEFNDLFAEAAYGSTMTAELQVPAKGLAVANRKAARQLMDSDYEWPVSVAPSIERVAEELFGDSASLSAFAREDVVTPIDWHTSGKSADRIRLRLGLPPAGTGCKKYVG